MRKRDDEKERNIKDAVIKLILQEGFQGTSIAKIARMAGVSPATVYIYFDSKEDMLQNIYYEYSDEIFEYLLDQIDRQMEGRQIIEMLIRGYYDYILGHKEIFSFVEQFSNCPSLSSRCTGKSQICHIYHLLEEMKRGQVIRNYNDDNVMALMFYPVKAIAMDNYKNEAERDRSLQELIQIVQQALLL
ncbi:MAG: transcriptional regulator, TetR family [Oscillospiraceae bacterium]|nr:transcriptional regulator, TetR family [Oscillospiraceae bacterium]